MFACIISFVDILLFPFNVFGGDVRREFMHRLFAAPLGTLGTYLREALQEGNVDVVACLHVPRASACGVFLLAPFCLVISSTSTAFYCKTIYNMRSAVLLRQTTIGLPVPGA
jgi:hypothetical protein